MIVRCPECSTGFKLPADRVGPKGAKVRCTKCDHVFRVRIANGEPEIFYKPGEEPAKSQPSTDGFGNKTAFGGPHSFATDGTGDEDSEVRETGGHTAIGRPGDLANIRSTPKRPLASISGEEADEAKKASQPPMAAGIINRRTIKKTTEPDDDDDFSGPGMAEDSEGEDATSIGKPIEESYSPKATSFGLPAVGGGDDGSGDDPFDDDSVAEDTARTNFGFPADAASAMPDKGFGEVDGEGGEGDDDAEEEDDHLRGTAFGRPAFNGEEESEPDEKSSFEQNPKGTLFGLPAVTDEDESSALSDDDGDEDGGLDLFTDDPPEPDVDQDFDDDPFAGAFEDKIDDSPANDLDPSLNADDPFGFGEDNDQEDAFEPSGETFDPNIGAAAPLNEQDESEGEDDAFFMGGGGGSDFGDPNDMVDPSFGTDGPSFDPNAGSSVDEPAGAGSSPGEIDFGDEPVGDVDLVMETTPPPAAERERSKSAKTGKTKENESRAPSSASGQRRVAVPAEVSALQKVMNFILILMLVICAFIGVVLYKTGGVIDFARFDHMLGIVIEGKAFEPRPEWGVQKRTTNDLEPLQVTNVFAFENDVKDGKAFLVRGEVENEGTSAYGSIKVRVSLVGPNGGMLADQVVSGGTKVDTRKLEELTPDSFADAVERQMSNIDPDSSIPFVAIFEEMPVNSVDELDILVEVTEKTEITKEAK